MNGEGTLLSDPSAFRSINNAFPASSRQATLPSASIMRKEKVHTRKTQTSKCEAREVCGYKASLASLNKDLQAAYGVAAESQPLIAHGRQKGTNAHHSAPFVRPQVKK